MKNSLLLLTVIAVTLSACGGHQSGAVADGEETGHCYPNGTCNAGLSCFSDRCVRYGAGAGGGSLAAMGADSGGATGSAGTTEGGHPSDAGTAGAGGVGHDASVEVDASAETGGVVGADSSADADRTTDGNGADATRLPDAANACTIDDAGPDGTTDVMTVKSCGYTPGTTTHAYAGQIRMNVTGVFVDNGAVVEDAFYLLDPNNTAVSTGSCPDCFRYNRFNEGAACVCFSAECPNHRVVDLLAEPYPPFNPVHEYSVRLDLGNGPPERLDFGMGDCGCDDNSGTYTVGIIPLGAVTCP